MTDEIIVAFPYLRDYELTDDVLMRISKSTENIRQYAFEVMRNMLLIGVELENVKEILPHGAWLKWLESEFNWTNLRERTAQRYIRVVQMLREYQVTPAKTYLDAFMASETPFEQGALYELAKDEVPDNVRHQAFFRFLGGEQLTVRLVNTLMRTFDEAVHAAEFAVDLSPEVAEIASVHGVTDNASMAALERVETQDPELYDEVTASGALEIEDDEFGDQVPLAEARPGDFDRAVNKRREEFGKQRTFAEMMAERTIALVSVDAGDGKVRIDYHSMETLKREYSEIYERFFDDLERGRFHITMTNTVSDKGGVLRLLVPSSDVAIGYVRG